MFCDLEQRGEVFRCRCCGWTYPKLVKRSCDSRYLRLNDVDAIACRGFCETSACEHFREKKKGPFSIAAWCQLDVQPDPETRGCVPKAVALYTQRLLRLHPPCPRWPVAIFRQSVAEILPKTIYITTEMLGKHSQQLAAKITRPIDAVVGVARSGIFPAGIVAAHHHVPLLVLTTDGELVSTQSGKRLSTAHEKGNAHGIELPSPKIESVLVVDDTSGSGKSLKRACDTIRKMAPRIQLSTAAVYASHEAANLIDYAAAILTGAHFLEWNLWNAGCDFHLATDLDGVLCPDVLREDDDDGVRYRVVIRAMIALHRPQRVPLKAIITARLERWRPETTEWLDRLGIRFERLIMWPGDDPAARWIDSAAARWKAAEYKALDDARIYVESDPHQARIIAAASGKAVLCPASGGLVASD